MGNYLRSISTEAIAGIHASAEMLAEMKPLLYLGASVCFQMIRGSHAETVY